MCQVKSVGGFMRRYILRSVPLKAQWSQLQKQLVIQMLNDDMGIDNTWNRETEGIYIGNLLNNTSSCETSKNNASSAG